MNVGKWVLGVRKHNTNGESLDVTDQGPRVAMVVQFSAKFTSQQITLDMNTSSGLLVLLSIAESVFLT